MLGFWEKLPSPFLALAPMEDVTDTVFRRLIASCGRPHVFFTEFTSTDGLNSVGRDNVAHRLKYTEGERPLVAQIWGNKPENYLKTAKDLKEMGFDGLDINMGCPVAKIVKNGCCSALIDNPTLAKELVLAAKEGAGDMPVSVKTRLGFKQRRESEWVEMLLSLNIAALTMHGRTAKQMSDGKADWDAISICTQIRDQMGVPTKILGNGDITSHKQAVEYAQRYKVDGIMVGRGIFKDPYLFNPDESITIHSMSPHQRLDLLMQHVNLYFETWAEQGNYRALKRFFKIYVAEFDGASALRSALVEADTREQMQDYIDQFLSYSQNRKEQKELYIS